jgi:hypothetical protein
MSRTFARFFSPFFKTIDSHYPMKDIEVLVTGTIMIGGILGHGAYTLGTTSTKIIRVKHKYQFDRNGLTEFMIIDDNGKHYNVNNSFWYWKWDSIEDWHKLETSKEINIKYYGWRVPLFGIFPNIVFINP